MHKIPKKTRITCTRAPLTYTHTHTRIHSYIAHRNGIDVKSEGNKAKQQLISNQHANFHIIPIIQLVDKRISSNIININYHLFRQTQAQQNAVNVRCSSCFVDASLLPFTASSFARLFLRSLCVFFYVSVHSMCIECLFKQTKLPTKYETNKLTSMHGHIFTLCLSRSRSLLHIVVCFTPYRLATGKRFSAFFCCFVYLIQFSSTTNFHFQRLCFLLSSISLPYIKMNRT